MLENLDFQVLRRRAWLIALVMVVGALAALVVSQLRETEYESHAQLMVGPGVDSPNPDLNVLRASAQLIQMYAELPLTEPFLQNVIDEVGLEMRPGRLADYVEVSPNQDTLILTVTVTYPDPEIAAAITSSIADQLVKISPSNPDSPAAQLKAQVRSQATDLENTVEQIKNNISALQADYNNVVTVVSPTTGTGQYANFMSDTLTQQQIAEISGTAAAQSTVGLDILQELVTNSSARIQVFEQQLTADASAATQQVLISQLTAERAHLSQLQQAIAELQRPVGGVSLDEYIQVNAQELANLQSSPEVLNFDFRRLQFERILEQEARLENARQVESDRQKLILDQVARERDRISQIEQASNQKQQVLLDEIASEQSRQVDTQNALALLYESLRQAEPNQVRIVEVGSQPKALDTPVFLAMLIGALAGLGLSTLGVLAVEAANDIIDTADELKHVLAVPVVDATWNVGPADNLLGGAEPNRRQVQNSQMLSLGLIYNKGEAMSRFVVVSAADENGGAGAAAANLAITLALSGRRVILVDAEGGPQSISELFDLTYRPGLAEFLASSDIEVNTLVPIDRYPSLAVWPSGNATIEAGMLSSPRMDYHLKHLRERTDVLVVAAPVYRRPDALMLAKASGGVVLAVTKGATHTRVLRELSGSLKQVEANVIAAILRPARETGLWFDLRRVPSAGPVPVFDVAQAKTLPGLPIQRPAAAPDDLPEETGAPVTVVSSTPASAPTEMIQREGFQNLAEAVDSGEQDVWANPEDHYDRPAPSPAKTQELRMDDELDPRENDRNIDEYMAKTIVSGLAPSELEPPPTIEDELQALDRLDDGDDDDPHGEQAELDSLDKDNG